MKETKFLFNKKNSSWRGSYKDYADCFYNGCGFALCGFFETQLFPTAVDYFLLLNFQFKLNPALRKTVVANRFYYNIINLKIQIYVYRKSIIYYRTCFCLYYWLAYRLCQRSKI